MFRAYLSRIETGNALPTPEQLTAIEAALGIQFDDPAVVAAFAVLSGAQRDPTPTTPIKP